MKKNNVLNIALGSMIGTGQISYPVGLDFSEIRSNKESKMESAEVNSSETLASCDKSWTSVDEVNRECYGWCGCLADDRDLSFKYIKGRVEATAKEALDSNDTAKIGSAICKLWEAGGDIDSKGVIYEVRKIIGNDKEGLKKL